MSALLVAGGVFREVLVGGLGDQKREVRLAGSGLYAAVAAARLGADVTLVAPVGKEDARLASALCDEAGVDPRWLVTPGASATFAMPRTAGARPQPQYRPADARVSEEAFEGASAQVVLAFGHPEWDPCVDAGVAASAREATFVWDGQGWLSRSADAVAVPAARRVQVTNAEELFDDARASPAEVITAVPAQGFDAAVVKDGPWGVRVVRRSGDPVVVAAFDVPVRQTVGSGDVFAGALCGALTRGATLEAACEAAMAAAAAWIASDESLPGAGFREALAEVAARPRRAVVAPDRLRQAPAHVASSDDAASQALAEAVRGMLADLGLHVYSSASPAGSPGGGVRVDLSGHELGLAGDDPGPLNEVERRLATFVAETFGAS